MNKQGADMSDNYRENVSIVSQEKLASDVFSMWIQTKDIAKNARAGQFISVYSKDGSRLLPRPISICEVEGDRLRIVYRTVGKGTKEFSMSWDRLATDIQSLIRKLSSWVEE